MQMRQNKGVVRELSILLGLAALTRLSLADPVDDFVKKEMEKQHIAGLSIGVLIKNKLIKAKGYGMANLELGVPASSDTVYEIGSITKQFTATAVMMLVEEGKVSLDEKAAKYLTGLPDAWKDVTVRQLLTHTSGIKSYTGMADFFTVKNLDRTHEAVIKYVSNQPMDFAP